VHYIEVAKQALAKLSPSKVQELFNVDVPYEIAIRDFVSASNLHSTSTTLNNAGTPILSVTTDMDLVDSSQGLVVFFLHITTVLLIRTISHLPLNPFSLSFLFLEGTHRHGVTVAGAVGVTWLMELLRFGGGKFLFLDQQDRPWLLGLVLVIVLIISPDGAIRRKSKKTQLASAEA